MPTLIFIQRSLERHEGWRPSILAIFNVEHASPVIFRYVVISEAGDSPHLCVFIEIISSGCIRDETEEIFISQIVDPWQWSVWSLDYILLSFVIKMSELQFMPPVVSWFIE